MTAQDEHEAGRRLIISAALHALGDRINGGGLLPTSIDLWTQYVPFADLLILADEAQVPILLHGEFASITWEVLQLGSEWPVNCKIQFNVQALVADDIHDEVSTLVESHNTVCLNLTPDGHPRTADETVDA